MTRRRASIGLALLALSLAGCNVGSEDRALFAPPPAMERTLGRAASKEVGAWPVADWWRQFRSNELDGLILAALEENQDLKRVYDRLHQAQAITEVEGANLLPFFKIDTNMVQHRVAKHGVEASYNPAIAGQEKTAGNLIPNFYYEFDFWGKTARRCMRRWERRRRRRRSSPRRSSCSPPLSRAPISEASPPPGSSSSRAR